MSIKAAFFDVDGTLISHKHGNIPEDTRMALGELKKRGIRIFTSTGRHILEFAQLPIRDIEFDGYVLLNGQLCLNNRREVLCGSPIDEHDIQQVLPLFEKKELPIAFVKKDRIYINFIDERVKQAQKAISSELPDLGEYHPGKQVYLVNVFSGREEAYGVLEQMPHCKLTWWTEYGTDIIAKSGGKVMGMRQVLDIYGIRPEEIIAFGDGENDTEMMEFSGIGVAMGNGEDFVKEHADYVTDDVDKGGILHALQHFGII